MAKCLGFTLIPPKSPMASSLKAVAFSSGSTGLLFKDKYDIKDNGKAFASWVVSFIHDLSWDKGFDHTDTQWQGDGCLDGWYYNKKDMAFNLHQSYFAEDPSTLTGPNKGREVLIALDVLLNNKEAHARSEKIGKISDDLLEAIENGASIILHCIVFCEMTDTAKREFQNLCSSHKKTPIPEIWDINRLYKEDVLKNTTDWLRSEIKIPIDLKKQFKITAPEGNNGIGESMVLNINAKEFLKKVKEHIPLIFAPNVRQSLGYQKSPNRDMRDTITSPNEHSNFWYYNNGLTIIVKDMSIKGSILTIKDPGIVNGAQTISVLNDNYNNISEKINFLAKIIKVDNSDNGKKIAGKITKATNSQSPVSTIDLHANDEVQFDIQRNFSRDIKPPWYYERKKGEFNGLSPAKKRQYRGHHLKREELAQTYYSYIGHPAAAIKSKSDIWEESDIRGEIFQTNRDPHIYLLSYVLFKLFDSYMKESRVDDISEFIGNPFNDTFQHLRYANKLVVGHCVALSKALLEHRYNTRISGSQTIVGELTGPQAKIILNLLETNEDYRNNLLSYIFSILTEYTTIYLQSKPSKPIKESFEDDDTIVTLNLKLSTMVIQRRKINPISNLFCDLN